MKTNTNPKIYHLLVLILLLAFAYSIAAPANQNYNLFKINRSKNADEIRYDINLKTANQMDPSNPIKIYWIKNTKSGQSEPLTWIQKNYAYGLKFLDIGEESSKFQFVSYPKCTFTIRKNGEQGTYRVFTNLDGREIEVNRIFVQFDGGTFWFPAISKVSLFGIDPENGNQITYSIKP